MLSHQVTCPPQDHDSIYNMLFNLSISQIVYYLPSKGEILSGLDIHFRISIPLSRERYC